MHKGSSTIEFLIPIVAGTILLAGLTVFIIYFILLYRRSQDRFRYERERLKQELLRIENEVKEQTLENVSREIHDNFGQIASLIKINLNLLSRELEGEQLEKAQESMDLLKQLITDMKSLSRSLNGESIRTTGWIAMIETDVERINRLGIAYLTFLTEGDPLAIEPGHQLILYRVVQEMMNNLLKHANASQAFLSILARDGQIHISYADNGVGFDKYSEDHKPGAGLTNMEARCSMIGAGFTLTSIPGQGTQIQIIC